MVREKEGAFWALLTSADVAEWMYRPIENDTVSKVLELIYSGPPVREQIHRVPPHRLASVMMVFALALAYEGQRPESAKYFNAASALLCVPERHFMVRHSVAAVETLHLMVSYTFNNSHPDGAKAAWPILGLCIRLANSIGLHRDQGEWGLSEAQKEHHAVLWWESMTYEILQSLNFGRPYSTPMQLSDCPMPPMPPDGGAQPNDAIFHLYKYRLGQVFVPVANYLAMSKLPDYSTVLKMDSEIRKVEAVAPAWLKWQEFGTAGFAGLSEKQIVQQHSATIFFHMGLLCE